MIPLSFYPREKDHAPQRLTKPLTKTPPLVQKSESGKSPGEQRRNHAIRRGARRLMPRGNSAAQSDPRKCAMLAVTGTTGAASDRARNAADDRAGGAMLDGRGVEKSGVGISSSDGDRAESEPLLGERGCVGLSPAAARLFDQCPRHSSNDRTAESFYRPRRVRRGHGQGPPGRRRSAGCPISGSRSNRSSPSGCSISALITLRAIVLSISRISGTLLARRGAGRGGRAA